MLKTNYLLVGLTLLSLSAMIITPISHARADNGSSSSTSPSSGAQKFGSTNCSQKVPCPDSSDYMSASELASVGNACMASGFGIRNENGFFDDVLGLDINNCLTVRSGLTASKDAKMILPLCCVTMLPDNTCTLHCDLYNNWH